MRPRVSVSGVARAEQRLVHTLRQWFRPDLWLDPDCSRLQLRLGQLHELSQVVVDELDVLAL